MNKSEQINELASALAKAQAEFKGAKADSTNPFFKSKYADLQSVWEAVRTPLTSNGLSVIQITEESEKGTLLQTILVHSSGQYISSSLYLRTKDDSPQALGSALSYTRRYALAALLGVYQTDDDANVAQGLKYENQAQKPTASSGANPYPTSPSKPDALPNYAPKLSSKHEGNSSFAGSKK